MVAMIASIPPPGGVWTVLAQWRPEPVSLALLLGVGSLYTLGVVRADRSGRRWPPARAAWFASGLFALAIALLSPVDAYSDVSLSVHMGQHLVLTMLAPPLLALGAPITLALRAASPPAGRVLSAALRSRVATVLANPVVGWALFVCVPVAIHASRLFDAALRSGGWHAVEHGLWLGAALVYWWPIVGVDPNPHPVPYPVRVLSLLLAMPAMSFLALAIYAADSPLYATYAGLPAPWGPGALEDQRDAAVLMWLVGNLATVLALLLVAASWKRDDDARQRRREALVDAIPGSPAGSNRSGRD
jgi:cytochrome c oxidase assembly factor CtaG